MNRYIFQSHIGHGSFAAVSKFIDTTNNTIVAIKKYDPMQQVLDNVDDASLRKRFIKEIRYQSMLDHPNIVRIIDSFFDFDPPFFTMSLASCSLHDELKVDHTLGSNLQKALFDVLAGLEHLHNAGYVHRDLKPDNILKYSDGINSYYAISDFGLISAINSESTHLTGTNATGGTALYAAPELMDDFKRATPAADIYSFGAILHDIFSNRASRIPYSEINYPGEIGKIISKCTKTLPIRRYSTIAALRDDLYRVLTSQNITFNSPQEERIIELLKLNRDLDDNEWDSVFLYLERSSTLAEKNVILSAISISHINFLLTNHPDLFTALGDYFADLMISYSFDFDYCDILASKAEIFYNNCHAGLKAKLFLALLELGTSHNRWYVERKVVTILSKAEPSVINRICAEIKVTDFDFKNKIIDMERSIGFNRNNLPAELQAFFR
ncbi:protein kinase domain-containing protein [Providencia rettgeri]